jgi:putative membrane protein
MENNHFNFTLTFFHFVVSGFGILITSKVINHFKVSGFVSAFIAAIVLAFANSFIWPILIFLTLPINILTLGLFTFVVNGAILKITAMLTPGFEVKGWFAAIFGSLFISVFNMILHYVLI